MKSANILDLVAKRSNENLLYRLFDTIKFSSIEEDEKMKADYDVILIKIEILLRSR
jgi:hypothetical protein